MVRAYRIASQLMSAALVALGVALVAATLARGGGPVAFGVVIGVLMALLGVGRLVLARPPRHAGEPPGPDRAPVRRER